MNLLLSIAFIHLVALVTPGPDFLFVSQTAISRSRRAAVAAVAGITVGVTLWAMMALAGWHIVLEHLPWLQRILVVAGGLYLIYLGILLLRAARSPRAAQSTTAVVAFKEDFRYFLRGVFTNLSNPKALIYFGSVFSLLVSSNLSMALRAGVLALMAAETFAWFLFVALMFRLAGVRRAYERLGRFIDGGCGLLFAGLGVFLVVG